MLTDQLNAQIRQALTAVGTILGLLGFIAPADAATWINTAMAVIGPLMIVASSIWSIYSNLKTSQIAAVKAMPEVKGVVTTNTPEGRALAAAIPGPEVAAAGTPDAKIIATTPKEAKP